MNLFSKRIALAKWFYEIGKQLEWLGVEYKHGYKKFTVDIRNLGNWWTDRVEEVLEFYGINYTIGYKRLVIDLPKMAKLNEKGEVK